MKIVKYLSCIAAGSLLLAGCGGGGSSVTPPSSHPGGTQGATVKFTLTVPSRSPAQLRRRNYVSFNTQGLGVTIVATGGSTPLPSTVAQMRVPMWATTIAPGFNLANTQQGATCTAPATPGASYTCTIILTMPVGYDDVQITTWDQAPAFQGFNASCTPSSACSTAAWPATASPAANNLSFQNIRDQLVELNTNNTFNYTLDGIVSSVSVEISPNSLITGAATGSSVNPMTPSVNVKAIDADGNTIIGSDPLVDANGNQVYITVSPSPAPVTSPSPAPAGSLAVFHLNNASTPATNDSCSALAANGGMQNPTQGSCIVTYDGGDTTGLAVDVTVHSGSASGPLENGVALLNGTLGFTRTNDGGVNNPGPPSLTEYAASPALPANVVIRWSALGSDGNVWSNGVDSVANVNDGVAKVTPAGTVTYYTFGNGAVNPFGIVAAPDQNLWITENVGFKVDRVDPRASAGSLSITRFPAGAGTTTGQPTGIAIGSDNNVWFNETGGAGGGGCNGVATCSWIGTISYDGSTLNEYPIATNASSVTLGLASGPHSAAAGNDPNGDLWSVDEGLGDVYEINPSTHTVVQTCPLPAIAGAAYKSIVAGPDGNLWIGDFNGFGANASSGHIVKMTPACITTTYPSSGSLNTDPDQLSVGPDGAIWAAGHNPDEIVRIDVTTGSIQQYPSVINGATYFSGSNFHGIATGSDNNLWFTENAGFGKIVP